MAEQTVKFTETTPIGQEAICNDLSKKVTNSFLEKTGVKNQDDLIRLSLCKYSGGAHSNFASSALQSLSPQTLDSRLSEVRARVNEDRSRDTTYKFESNGGVVIGDLTAQLDAVIQEDYGQYAFGKSIMDSIVPDRGATAQKIYYDVWAAPGGLIDAYTPGSQVKGKNQLATRVASYTGQDYRNYIRFQENDLLYRRRPGGPGFDTRGIINIIAYNVLKARTQIYNRKLLLKNTIFFNGDTVLADGSEAPNVISYGIPSYNQVLPASGEEFGTITSATGDIVINTNANIIEDYTQLLNSDPAFRTRHNKLNRSINIMNPNTMQLFTSNPDIAGRLTVNLTNPTSQFSAFDQYEVNNLMHNFLPGFNGTFVVDGSAYLEEDSSSAWDQTAGTFGLTPPAQQYFIPDGKILVAIEPMDSPLAELVEQPSLQRGGVVNPQTGEWLQYQEIVGSAFAEGLTTPYSQIVYGVQMGIRVMNPVSIIIFDVATVI